MRDGDRPSHSICRFSGEKQHLLTHYLVADIRMANARPSCLWGDRGTGMPLAHYLVTGVPHLGETDGLDAVALGTGVPLALALATG